MKQKAPEYSGTPRWVKTAGAITLVLVIIAIAFVVLGGGEHGPGRHGPGNRGGPDTSSDAASSTTCRTDRLDHGGGTGAEIVCQTAEGAATHKQDFPCQNPRHGGLQAEWDLHEGEMTVTLKDSEGSTVLTKTYTGKGSESPSISGQSGTWTLTVQRSEQFSGSLSVQTFCAS